MTFEIALVIMILAGVALAFVREWATPDVVAIAMMSALLLPGLFGMPLIEMSRALDAFSNAAPVTVACMFIISAGLEQTGCIAGLARIFHNLAGAGEVRVILVLMVFVAILSAFINNTPVVVVFLPIVLAISRSTGIKASRLLIPLSFAAILGGTCTTIGTSANVAVNGLVSDLGMPAFSIFELTKLGVVYAAVGITYMLVFGRRLLPARESLDQGVNNNAERRNFLTQVEVKEGSPLIGQSLVDSLIAEFSEAKILEVRRRGQVLTLPLDQLEIQEGDRILLTVHGLSFQDFKKTGGLRFESEKHLRLQELETRELKLMEGIVGSDSSLVGKTLKNLRFRQRYGVLILAVHRRGTELDEDFGHVKLKFGDTLLVEGPAQAIDRLRGSSDIIALTDPPKSERPTRKAWVATLLVLVMICGAGFEIAAIEILALLAAAGMIVTCCIEPTEAYRSVQWNIVFLIAGMLMMGMAMEDTGTALLISEGMGSLFGGDAASALGDMRGYVALAVIYVVCSILTEIISNNAVAPLLAPIAIGTAAQLGFDPRPFLVAVMFGCSASFATPIGYQTNTYVYGAGGYRFGDFLKVGLPLNILLAVLATFLIPRFWPF